MAAKKDEERRKKNEMIQQKIMETLPAISQSTYGELHKPHLLEIYKLYVEMADRISARRQSANYLPFTHIEVYIPCDNSAFLE